MRLVKRVGPIAACVLLPVAALAGGNHWAFALFDKLPHLPKDAKAAYSQWVDHADDGLRPGVEFTRFENAYKSASMVGTPSVAQQKNAAAIAAEYGTPAGQANMRNMSPAQAMALGQKIQAAMGMQTGQYVGPVSPHDRRLADGMGVYPGTADLTQKLAMLDQQRIGVGERWKKEAAALDHAESADIAKLPDTCTGEAGGADPVAIRAVHYKYDDKRIALASSYIAKFAPIVQQYGIDVRHEVDYADSTYEKWTEIGNPGLKAELKPTVEGTMRSAFNDTARAEGLIKDISKSAAQTVADHKATERQYANATGC